MWLIEDTEALLARQADKAARCPGCGNLWADCTDKEREREWTADAVRCHACKAKGLAGKKVDDAMGLYVFPRLEDQL